MSLLHNQWKALSVSLTDAILTISMNRPKANAMSPELLNELIQAFNQASNDKQIKGVLLRSNLKYLTFQHISNIKISFSLVLHSVPVLIFQQYTIYLSLVNEQQLINSFLIHLVVV
jgi:uncharacterized membrane protein YukC